MIDYYLANTNRITAKEKLAISRCYIAFGDFPDALPLARDYVNTYSNDFHGWGALAYCYVAMTNHAQAIDCYLKSVELGDKAAYQALAGEAIRSQRLDIIGKIVPQLIALQRAKETSQDDKISLTRILLAYSLMADKQEIFAQTLQGQNMKELLKNDKVREDVTSGCQMFKGEDIDKIRLKLDSDN